MVHVGATGWLTTDNDWVGFHPRKKKKKKRTTRAALFSVACFSQICARPPGSFNLLGPEFCFLKNVTKI